MKFNSYLKKATTWLLSMLMVVFLLPTGVQFAFGAVTDAPATSKTLIDNGDGTYTLALSVTGASESSSTTEVTKANVILVLDTSNSMNNNRTTYNGNTMTRLAAEKRVLTDEGGIIDSLLAQNVAGDSVKSDIIEVAIANFGTRGSTAQSFTTNASTLKSTVNGLTNSQGTNWEEGLMRAQELATSIKASQPDEEVYIIFLTDGEPTTHNNSYNVNTNYATEWGYASDNARAIVTAGYHFYGIFTWGSGNSSHYLSSLVQYAYTGTGNSNSSLDSAYAQYYTDATSTEALIAALNQITHDITSSVGYTNVELEDGVTSMTTSNVKTTASGTVTGLKYYRSGGDYSTTANNGLGEEWADAPAATINDDGEVDWDLGDTVLEDGVTYTVTFVVWPSQESVDLVADLNNDVKSYESLTDDEKSQINVSGGSYTLKTNTDYPTVTYSTVTTTTVDGVETIVVSDPQTATIKNPDPVGLDEAKMPVEKKWDDSLDPSQREEVEGSVSLDLIVDGETYEEGIVLSDENDWKDEDGIFIAPGLMVSTDSPAYSADYTQVTYGGKTYAILEEGHDYVFEEKDINSHFELTAYSHHPMLVDGKLYYVTFEYDGEGNITAISDMEETDTLSATNTIKGGANISKVVVDEEGNKIEDCTDPFTMTVHITDADGNELPTKTTEDGTSYAYDYRIYYGENNPAYATSGDQHRSDHIYGTGTSFEVTLYAGDVVRIVNVEDGSLYRVVEADSTGYTLKSTDYTIKVGSNGEETANTANEDGYYPIKGNSASNTVVTNTYKYGELDITKTVAVAEDSGLTIDEDKEFTFTVKLYADSTKETELTGRQYSYSVYNSGSETAASTGTLTEGDTIKLKHGQTVKIDKLPEGAYYEVTEAEEDGYTITKTGDTGTIGNNETAEAEFTNTYAVEPVSVDPPVQKVIENNDALYNGGNFTFTIANTSAPEGVTAPMPAKTSITNIAGNELENKKGYYEFGEIEFTVPGTYVYTVTESGSAPGVTNDSTTSKTITFTVTDEKDGTLSVSPTTDEVSVAFTNTYKTGELDITKTVTCDDKDKLAEGQKGEFTFTVNLYADDTKATVLDASAYSYTVYEGTEEVGTGKGGTVTLKHGQTVKYTDLPDGVYYEVVETTAEGYDLTAKTGDAGTVDTEKAQAAAFTNDYRTTEAYNKIQFTLKKTDAETSTGAGLVGAVFTVTKPDETTVSFTTGDDGTIVIDCFTEPGEYTMVEDTAPAGYTKVDGTWTIVVDKDQDKAPTVKYKSEGNVFEWLYDLIFSEKPSEYLDGVLTIKNPPTTKSVTATKVWDDASDQDGRRPSSVTYQLYKTVNGTTSKVDGKTVQIKAGEEASNTWTAVIEDLPAFEDGYDVTYSFKELNASGAEVADKGKLNDDYTAAYSEDGLTVTNTHTPDVTTVEGQKTWAGDEEFADDVRPAEITVSLLADGKAAKHADGTAVEAATVTADDNWAYSFDNLPENAEGKAIKYTVEETAVAGYTTTYDGMNITNTYSPSSTTVSFPVKKVMEVPDKLDGPETWTYSIKVAAEQGAPSAEVMTSEVTNAADTATFGPFTFTMPGTYTYTVSETGTVAGVTNDADAAGKKVTVTVTGNTSGGLRAVASSTSTDPLTFTNTYSAKKELDTNTDAVLTKTVEGKNFAEKTFSFSIKAGEGAPAPEKTTGTATFKEAGEQVIDFGKITFTEEGTYTYTVTETTANGDGWVCDNEPKTVTITVTDNGDGTLTATPSAASITNKYEPTGELDTGTETGAVLKKTVNADGTAWAPKTFDFTIAAVDGAPLAKDADGEDITSGSATFTKADTLVIDFGKITYTEAGTYTYNVKETTEGGNGWTCDNEEKTVTVKVTDDGYGKLTATVDPSAAVVTNEYKPTGDLDSSTTAVLTKTVEAEGTEWAPKEFDFTIAAVDGAPLGKDAAGKEVTTGSASFDEAGTQTIDFGTFTFTKAGEYKYTVTETTESGDGWTCDNSAKTVTITVVDNGDGTLTATPSAASITNVYNTAGDLNTSISPVLTKTVVADGTEWAPKTFDFTIAAVDGAPLAKDEDGENITSGSATFEEAGTQNIDFGTIHYTKAGKYTYTVTETTGGGDGWVCDNEAKTVTVTVTDNGNGTLTASVDKAASITNEYKPEGTLDTDAEATAVLTKTVEADGTEWAPKKFDFTIAAVDGAPLAKDDDGKDITSGSATFTEAGTKVIGFGEIKYTKAGTYNYVVKETTTGTEDGWVYDNAEKTVTVTVTDDGKGNLTATAEPASITNEYKPEGTLDTDADTSAVLKKIVVAEGTKWAPKTFDFTIAPVDGAPAPQSSTGSATFTEAGSKTIGFGKITFTKAGEYKYTVTETTKGGDGWTCDNEPKTVTVNVKDNGDGTLTATVKEVQTVTNTYNTEGTLDTKTTAVLTKTVEADGTAWADKTFDFTIAAATAGAPAPTKAAGTATFSEAGTKTIDFGTITFTHAGEYEYTVTETTQSGDGWTCDNEPKTVKITVTDNGDGTLTAKPEAVDIKNVYEAKAVNTQIKVTKTVEGYKTDEGSADDTYTMTLAAVGDAPMPEEAEAGVLTVKGSGEALFGEIEYTEPGEYKYTVTETAGSKPGVTYDDTTYEVTVTVEDNGKGQLAATVDYGAGSSDSEETKTSVDVTNTFAVESVDVVMSVTKQIDDQSNSAEDATFKFVLKDADKNVLQTKEVTTSGLKGSANFDAVTFDHDGEYTFYIQESVSEEDAAKLGWTYDTNEYPVVVKISDNLNEAKLVKDGVTYDNDKTELVVTNIYKAEPATVSNITVNKTIEDTSGSAYETTFTFTLTAGSNDAGVDTPMPDNSTASVTGEGSVTFAGIEYEKAGVYNYTVTEEASGAAGYEYDTATYNVVVTVTDEGGKLVASVDYGKDAETGEAKTQIDVVNTYDPEDAKVSLTATKLIKDLTGSAPDATFTFELVDSEGNVVETVERENGGAVAFSELTFSKVGTYTYVIREVAGSTPGYKYDTTAHTVTITVTDPDEDGILKAAVEGNNPEIENPYKVDPGESSVTDDISVTKKLVGRDLEADEFLFLLVDTDGNVVGTATNDADGSVTFPAITFPTVGTYTYTVYEVEGELEDVTYDSSLYVVTATVTDPHNGDALEVSWDCDDESIVFTNTYEPPEKEHSDKPDTGDHNGLAGLLGLMGASAAGIGALIFRRKREQE